MRRRADAGELKDTRPAECDYLASWVQSVCANMEPPIKLPKAKTIARKLGTLYTQLRGRPIASPHSLVTSTEPNR